MTSGPGPQAVESDLVIREEIITPEYAAWLLQHANRNPRKLRPSKASQYATDMAAGNWAVGTSTLAFDKDGNLTDGQHRCAAAVEANVSFRSVVVRGVGQTAVDNADRGMKRAVSDILKERGEVSTAALQTALNGLVRWDTWGPLTSSVPTWPQMEQYLKDNPDVRGSVAMAMPLTRPPLGIRASVVAPVVHRVRQIDEAAAKDFVAKAASGIGLSASDPVLQLREVFLTRRLSAYGRPTRVHDQVLMVKCWNAHITGRPLRALKWNRGGSRQEPHPYLLDASGKPFPFPDFLRDEERRNLSRLAALDEDDFDDDDETTDS